MGKPGESFDHGAQDVMLKKSQPSERNFLPEVLDRTIIAIPLLKILEKEKKEGTLSAGPQAVTHPVIIDLNLLYPNNGRKGARKRVEEFLIDKAIEQTNGDPSREGINVAKSALSEQYLFCRLSGETIRRLVILDNDPSLPGASNPHRTAVYHIWPDFRIKGLINKSISTVKADAAHRSFSALGENIVWAVIDSGVDAIHPHFGELGNLVFDETLEAQGFHGGRNQSGRRASRRLRAWDARRRHHRGPLQCVAGETDAGDTPVSRPGRQHQTRAADDHVAPLRNGSMLQAAIAQGA